MLDFRQLFDQHGVPYVTTGKNVARGHLNIRCPFCGPADPSAHMGIRLSDGAWGCWRDAAHRGRRPHRLLAAVLGWSFADIEALTGTPVDRSALGEIVRTLQTPPPPSDRPTRSPLTLPSEFRLISSSRASAPYWHYLRQSRGFAERDLAAVIQEYDLHYAATGFWKWRVILPVYDAGGSLQTWTGRALGTREVRYRTAPTTQAVSIRSCLFHERALVRESTYDQVLVVTEGPFDAMKVDWYGRVCGVRATCIFGSGVSAEQATRLRLLSGYYTTVVVAMDPENLTGTLRSMTQLAGLHVVPMGVSHGEDLGAMEETQIHAWCRMVQSTVGV